MASDFSRKTFDPRKHYSAVLKQQGRVDLDADWNEELDISQHRTQTETRDVIGASGVPKKGNSFKIIPNSDASDLSINPGHMYVGGLLCELDGDTPASYLVQPYYPEPDLSLFNALASPPASPPYQQLKDGTYLVYIDAWQHEVNYLDDHRIQEVALGEADTATRLQNVWQVKLLPVAQANATCKTKLAEWDNLVAAPTGKLNAQTKLFDDTGNPCVLPPSSGFRRLENQLYRIEIQKGGNLSETRFKWSRDNATVETKIESVDGSKIIVASMGKDEVLGFAGGQWVEIVSEETTLKNAPLPLFKIDSVKPAIREITLSSPVPADLAGTLKLRRWDQTVPEATADGLPALNAWTDLEDGVQVRFSPGTYREGDFWLIPARVATGEIEWPPYDIPNLSPQEQLPFGIDHYYCRLAMFTVKSGKYEGLQDCRPLFPSLTEICAEDICFDNNNCDFPYASNVQEALDLLCAANDIRDHNKYLHGTGVVCGLKIKCRVTRNGVIIEKGTALDCEGNMIQVKNHNGLPYDLVDKAMQKGLLDKDGNGKVALTIGKGSENGVLIDIEKYLPQSFWETVMEGTLLKDFYDGCIKNLLDFFKQQFPFPVTDIAPVPVTQKRLTALINLLFQMLNPKTGAFGFISGHEKQIDFDKEGDKNIGVTEDELLRKLYHELKDLLASETFCAMYDKDDPYPDYILDEGLDTIFGTSFRMHQRLRVSHDGKYAYTCGQNNKVYAYDLEMKEMIQASDFHSDTGIKMQDIVLIKDGKFIVGVGIQNDKDSVFGIGKIDKNGMIKWNDTSFAPGIKFMSLALGPSDMICGIGKASGYYHILNIGKASFEIVLKRAFNATGLMVIPDDRKFVVAAESNNAAGTESAEFNHMIVFNAENPDQEFKGLIELQGVDVLNDVITDKDFVFATGRNEKNERVVAMYHINHGVSFINSTEIDSSSFLRLARYSSLEKEEFLLITVGDALKVVRARLQDNVIHIDPEFRIPVQPYPVGIAIDHEHQMGYVLNTFVNTITSMEMVKVFFDKPAPDYTQEPPYNLANYRDKAIEAYKDVLSHFLQYLKDCFFDKFLIDCPDCDDDEKVYLGSVEVRNSQVYNICNFTKRKYVKNVQTVEYWLSVVPVIPMVKVAFSKFACTVLNVKQN